MRTDSFLTAAGGGPHSDVVDAALADSAPTVLWLDQPRPVAAPALDGPITADLVVVGGG
ncbi:uncharacterized protein METZ01_LOCUS475019, partial [marine metagenome]